MDEKEYDFKAYKKATIQKNVEKYGSADDAIFEMDARIVSLTVATDSLRELVDWDKLEEEVNKG